MKKRKIVALLFALCMSGFVFGLTACGGGSGNTPPTENPGSAEENPGGGEDNPGGSEDNPGENPGGDSSVMDVRGKTFVFFDITAAYPSDYDQALKDAMEAQLATGRVNAAGSTIVFGSDGTFSSLVFGEGPWTQDGSKVTVTLYGEAAEMKVNGNKIELSYIESKSGLTITEVYIISSSTTPGGSEDNPGGGTGEETPVGIDWEAALNFTINKNYSLTQTTSKDGQVLQIINVERDGDKGKQTIGDKIGYVTVNDGKYYVVDSSGESNEISEAQYISCFSQLTGYPKDKFAYDDAKGGFVNTQPYEVNGQVVSDALIIFDEYGCVQSISCNVTKYDVTVSIVLSVQYGNVSITIPGIGGGETVTDVKGNVYFFNKATATYSEDVTDEQKAQTQSVVSMLNSSVGVVELFYDFRVNGDVAYNGEVNGTWSQSGNTVTVQASNGSMIFTVKGDTIECSSTSNGATITTTYTYNKDIPSGYNPNNSGSGSGGNNADNGGDVNNGGNADNGGSGDVANPDNPGTDEGGESGGGEITNPENPGTGENTVLDVTGKTFVLIKVYPADCEKLTEEEWQSLCEIATELSANIEKETLTFRESGTCEVCVDDDSKYYSWIQDGDTVTVGNTEYTIELNYLVLVKQYGTNASISLYYYEQ